ncbi:response regulator [Actinoallomurus soli]|uniref:response regulator n=1 Tax=Actinoallomurus soli TaxID=2952535 RepID=UPI00209304EE|nr:response regulator [Actinoallomurus soli]MCO5969574.1 response regulator [Actinoallomurus soli]
MSAAEQRVTILIVEDDPGDQILIQEAFADHDGDPPRLIVLEDGQQALDFLYRRGAYADAPRPDLVLLDLNLPKYSGRAVLEQVKSDAELRSIPIVIFTTSANLDDISAIYLLRANAYVTKPVDLDAFTTAIQRIKGFFVHTARLPRTSQAA